MRGLVAVNGEIHVDPATARISPFDRGFLYGDAIFETLRVYDGEPFRVVEHVDRLFWSAERTRLTLPWSREFLVAEFHGLGNAASQLLGTKELAIRLMVSRGSVPFEHFPSGLPIKEGLVPLRVAFIHTIDPIAASTLASGVKAITSANYRPSDAVGGAKVGNYLESIRAIADARDHGAHEALILTTDGFILEGTTSNVFFVVDGALVTPSLGDTILPGLTRKTVIEIAHVPVVERRFAKAEIARASEAFITSSIREVLPISHVDDLVIGAGKPGPITLEVMRRFRAATQR